MPRITSDAKLSAIAEENALYLRHLRRTGNQSLAARFAKRARETFTGRRRADPEFDAQCEAAMVFARAELAKGGRPVPARIDTTVTAGGEYHVGPNRNRGLQVRRAKPGSVTAHGEEAFLNALAATANIRLAADAVGVDPRAFYKRRAQSPEFARRMQEALTAGYEAVEFALVGCALQSLGQGGAGEDDGGPVEPDARMSVDQAMGLIAQRTKTLAIGDRHVRGYYEKALPTPEETDAIIAKRLDQLKRIKERNPGWGSGE